MQPLLMAAGDLALVLLWSRVRSEPSAARLVAEVLLATVPIVGGLLGILTPEKTKARGR